jgi:molybdenum cofactor biosynthesis enzyme MoaA
MREKILLINPWIHDFSAYDLWIQPLGLLYLAAVLEQNDFGVHYINCLNARYEIKEDGRAHFQKQLLPTPSPLRGIHRIYGRYGISPDNFRNLLKQYERPDVVLVTSGMTYWYPGVQETIREVREIYPAARIFLGGIYATLMPDHARQYSGADVVVSEPSENTIVNLISNRSSRDPYHSLDDYPYPAWDLTEQKQYRILMTSRGCPYRCTFCASDILNEQKFIQRSIHGILVEIEKYYFEDGIRNFVFYDDALLINHKRHLEPLLSELIRRKINAHFHTPNGLNAREVDEGLAELMYQCGFQTIRLSLESVDPEIQKSQANRKITSALFEEAISNLYKAGYTRGDLECYLIMGLPNQTIDPVMKSLEFVSRLGVIARLATFSPIPGTPEAAKARKWVNEDFLQEPLFQNHSCFPLRNAGMNDAELQLIKLECKRNNEKIRKERSLLHRNPPGTLNLEIEKQTDLR